MERAFATNIRSYLLAGGKVMAPTTTPSLPARVARGVKAIEGLNTADVARPTSLATPPAPAYVNAPPFSSYWGQSLATQAPGAYGKAHLPNVVQGYTPQQLEGAYGVTGAIKQGLNGVRPDGRGDRRLLLAHDHGDADTWSADHGLPKPNLVINDNAAERDQPEGPDDPDRRPDPRRPQPPGPVGLVRRGDARRRGRPHDGAPQPTIVVQSALSDQAIDLEMAQNAVVAGDEAQIVSNSYGNGIDSTDKTSDGYWQQAAAAGDRRLLRLRRRRRPDAGSTQPADRSVDGSENSPYVTAVGGTTLAVGSHDNYEFETYWGTNTATLGSTGAWGPVAFSSGGGGGTSQVYAEPAYQKPVVPAQFSDYWKLNPKYASMPVVPGRVVPDVAMLGDPNSGVLTGLTEDFSVYENPLSEPLPTDATAFGQYRIGGTSLSSPLFAGMMALADQAAGKHHGFANPALYALAGSKAFHDITAPKALVAVVRTNYTNSTNSSGGTQTLLRTFGNSARSPHSPATTTPRASAHRTAWRFSPGSRRTLASWRARGADRIRRRAPARSRGRRGPGRRRRPPERRPAAGAPQQARRERRAHPGGAGDGGGAPLAGGRNRRRHRAGD